MPGWASWGATNRYAGGRRSTLGSRGSARAVCPLHGRAGGAGTRPPDLPEASRCALSPFLRALSPLRLSSGDLLQVVNVANARPEDAAGRSGSRFGVTQEAALIACVADVALPAPDGPGCCGSMVAVMTASPAGSCPALRSATVPLRPVWPSVTSPKPNTRGSSRPGGRTATSAKVTPCSASSSSEHVAVGARSRTGGEGLGREVLDHHHGHVVHDDDLTDRGRAPLLDAFRPDVQRGAARRNARLRTVHPS